MSDRPAARQLSALRQAMALISDAVEDMPGECRDHAGNALLNVAAEAVARDVGFTEASRIFGRLSQLLARGLQPGGAEAIPLNALDG
jgi:hypothetical protein